MKRNANKEYARKNYPLIVGNRKFRAESCMISADGTKYCRFVNRKFGMTNMVLRLQEGAWEIDDKNEQIRCPNLENLAYKL